MELMKKYIVPNEKNGYVPHLFRRTSAAAIAFLAVLIFAAGIFQAGLVSRTGLLSAVLPAALVDLANRNRSTESLGTLTVNPVLEKAAQMKADDMARNGYFSHNSPAGITPWHWFREAGYQYVFAGENLAVNFADSEAVDKAWMNSPTHRANIMNGRYTEIGIATARGMYKGKETTFVVQLFGKPLPAFLRTAGSPASRPTAAARATTTPATTTTLTMPGSGVLGVQSFAADVNMDTPESLRTEESAAPAASPDVAPSPAVLATSPARAIDTAYTALALFLSVALAIFVGIEVRRQSPRHLLMGVALIILILLLGYAFSAYIAPQAVELPRS